MKLCIIVTLICFVSIFSYGQSTKVDSLNVSQSQQLLKSSEQRVDSIQSAFYSRSDSLTKAYKGRLAWMDSAQHTLKTRFDSLAATATPTKILSGNGLDSIRMKWTSKVDSLRAIGHPPPELSAKFSDVTEKIEGFQVPGTDLNLPALNSVSNGSPIGNLTNIDMKLPAADIDLGSVDELKNINGGLKGITGNAGEYSSDVQQLSKGNINELKDLPEAAEAKVGELSGLSEVKGETETLNEYKDVVGQVQNPDSLKEFAVQEVKQAAVNHFAGKEEQLKQAMETLSKYKSKYSNLNSISDLIKRPPNEMKEKPFIERIVPGIGIQVQKKGEDVLVDFNAYAGYRFTGRITAGVGWNQRVAYTIDRGRFNSATRIYGPRAFGEYKLWKGFSPRAELEIMNTNIPPLTRTQAVDPLSREWVWGAFIGVKKEYRFIKKVKGTAMVMMRLFNPEHKSPYGDVVNVRFGFEFPFVRGKQ
jgi:hypothetical protein